MSFINPTNKPFRLVPSLAILITILSAGGCQSPSSADQDRPRESSIPWNKPQSWEGPGVLGSSMPGAGMQ